MTAGSGPVAGLLLAAGGGSRLGGRPKALLPFRGRPLVEHGVRVLREGGCAHVSVVLGAAADDVLADADLTGAQVVRNAEWGTGMGSSLRAGLAALPRDASAVVVTLVDMPGAGAAAVARLIGEHRVRGAELAAAAYYGRRGHPVLFASRWWDAVAAVARGDAGARGFLAAHAADLRLVECGDVAEAYDIDTPDDLGRLG
ncbi:nucleotidyltransferase family protein [Streptomycetaceae bacterium NBC_01309]